MDDTRPYITIYKSISGWKAVMLWWNDEDKKLGSFWEPYQTSEFAYSDPASAEADGKCWAGAEGLEYRRPLNVEEYSCIHCGSNECIGCGGRGKVDHRTPREERADRKLKDLNCSYCPPHRGENSSRTAKHGKGKRRGQKGREK